MNDNYWKNLKPFISIDLIPDLPGRIESNTWFDIIRPSLIRAGAISIEKLIPGKTYLGHCRNAHEATWTGTEFVYQRYKFGSYFEDSVPHFDNAWGLDEDVFIPVQIKKKEIIPRKIDYVVKCSDTKYIIFKKKEKALQFIKQNRPKDCYSWELITRKRPWIPVIRKFGKTWNVVSPSGTINICYSIGDAFRFWLWHCGISPRIAFSLGKK